MAPDATAKPKRKTQGRLFAFESTMTPRMTPTKQSANPTKITDITYRFFPLRWSRRVVIYVLLRSNVALQARAASARRLQALVRHALERPPFITCPRPSRA